MPAPGEERRFTKEKAAWPSESLCLKWWVGVRAGESQYPSHLVTREGWKRCPSSSMGADAWGVLWLGVRQCMSSVLETENETPKPLPLWAISIKMLCR